MELQESAIKGYINQPDKEKANSMYMEHIHGAVNGIAKSTIGRSAPNNPTYDDLVSEAHAVVLEILEKARCNGGGLGVLVRPVRHVRRKIINRISMAMLENDKYVLINDLAPQQ